MRDGMETRIDGIRRAVQDHTVGSTWAEEALTDLLAVHDAALEFRSAILADPENAARWLYEKGAAPRIEQASRELVELQAELLREVWGPV